MMIPVTTLALVIPLTVALADDIPHLNVEPVCHGIARQGALDLEPGQSVQQAFRSCVTSEMAVRRQLVKQWSGFTASERTNCIGEATAGGQSSYTDLLTCLQMSRDARKLAQ